MFNYFHKNTVILTFWAVNDTSDYRYTPQQQTTYQNLYLNYYVLEQSTQLTKLSCVDCSFT